MTAGVLGCFGQLGSQGRSGEYSTPALVVVGRYVRLNYMGFQMLTEKFDACLGISGSPLFVSGLHCEPVCNLANCRVGLRRAAGLWQDVISIFQSSTLTHSSYLMPEG